MNSPLPAGWVERPLEAVVDPARPITYGIVLPGADYPGGVPYVRVVDMAEGTVQTADLRKTSPEIAGKYRRSALVAGDVLLSIRGHVGRIAIVPPGLEGANLTQDTARIAVRDCDPGYVRWALQGLWIQRWMERHKKGASVKGINLADVRKIPIRLPPLPEQRRIAAILDQAEAIRRKRREALRLTEEFLRSAFLEMFGDIPRQRSRFEFVPVGPMVAMRSGKSSKDVLAGEQTNVPVYGGNGVNGYATRALITDPVVVAGRVGQQCGVIHRTRGPAWVTDNAIAIEVLRPQELDPVYLAAALTESPLRDTVTHLDLPFINQGLLGRQRIPLPPLHVQSRFRAITETVEAQKALLASAEQSTAGLTGGLAQRAFSGDL